MAGAGAEEEIVSHYVKIAVDSTARTLIDGQANVAHDDEKLKVANITNITSNGDSISAEINIESEAGTNVTFIVPISWVA